MTPTKHKQPGETLDYDVEFEDWMPAGDTIIAEDTTVPAGLIKDSTAINVSSHVVKVWLKGGTSGVRYKCTTKITTQQGRIKEKEFYLKVREL